MKDITSTKRLIVATLGALLLAVTLAGCTPPPEPVTAAEFIAAAENLSFEVSERDPDAMEFLADAGIISSLSASRGTATVIFDVYTDNSGARTTFNAYRNGIRNFVESPATEQYINFPGRSYILRRSSEGFGVASRIENTILFASGGTSEDFAAVDALIEALGYRE